MTVSRSVLEASELPRVIRLRDNLYVAAFGLMKLLPARFMLDRAEERGELGPGVTVLETSSGTIGLGLAMVCRLRGYDLAVVGDPAIDPALHRRLRQLGARVEICREPSPAGGFQQARLDRLARLRDEYPRHHVPGQYDNPDNPAAYAVVAELLADLVGVPDCLVGAVGSGGSTGGTAEFLRQAGPVRLVGVDTHGSVIFGQPDRPRLVRGLGNSLVPGNVRHELYDEVHWVDAATTFHATRALHSRHCLYLGPTSGAAFLVADWWARRNPDAVVVALLPDEGHRYQDTVYSDDWLTSTGLLPALTGDVPAAPDEVRDPGDGVGGWTRMRWGRRGLADVLAVETVA
jgi:S-sulfo-L-cysteine synthase (3-phospho-L-serine-dependent)